MLVAIFISPVAAFIDKPAVEEYVPPVVPVLVTEAVVTLLQYGEAAYAIVALGAVVMVIGAVVVKTGQPPAAATVYVIV